MVTDGLQKNVTAEHELGASYQRPWFFVRCKKNVTLIDVPHMATSVLNAVLQYVTLIDIKFIKASVLQEMDEVVRMVGIRFFCCFVGLLCSLQYSHGFFNRFPNFNLGLLHNYC